MDNLGAPTCAVLDPNSCTRLHMIHETITHIDIGHADAQCDSKEHHKQVFKIPMKVPTVLCTMKGIFGFF